MMLDETMAALFDSLPTGPVLRTFMQYSAADRKQIGRDSDDISSRFVGLIYANNAAKFRDPCVNSSRKIPPKAVRSDIFDSHDCRPEVTI